MSKSNQDKPTYRNYKFAFTVPFNLIDSLEDFSIQEKGIILDGMFKIALGRRQDPNYKFDFNSIEERSIRLFLRQFDTMNLSSEEHYQSHFQKSSEGGKNSHGGTSLNDPQGTLTDTDTVTDTETETVTETDTETVTDTVSVGRGAFEDGYVPPSLSEIRSFCTEKGLRVDPELFFSFYQERDWKANGSRLNSWKAMLLNWDTRATNKKNASSVKTIVHDPELEALF